MDIYVEERASEDPPAGVWCIYVAMWDCMRGGGREGERERERKRGRGVGAREKQPFVKTTRQPQIRQNHSTSTAHQTIDTRSKTF